MGVASKKGKVLSPGSHGLRVVWRTSNVIPYRYPHGYISTSHFFIRKAFIRVCLYLHPQIISIEYTHLPFVIDFPLPLNYLGRVLLVNDNVSRLGNPKLFATNNFNTIQSIYSQHFTHPPSKSTHTSALAITAVK